MINIKKENGMISKGRHLLISYTLDIPFCGEKDFPNGFFAKCAENYVKYLEYLAEKVLIPRLNSMLKSGARTREIREALSLPIKTSLVWEHFPCTKDRHAFSCIISAFGNDGAPTVRKKSLLIEKRSMTALRISEKRLRHLLESSGSI